MGKASSSHTYVDLLSRNEHIHEKSRTTYFPPGTRPVRLGQNTGKSTACRYQRVGTAWLTESFHTSAKGVREIMLITHFVKGENIRGRRWTEEVGQAGNGLRWWGHDGGG